MLLSPLNEKRIDENYFRLLSEIHYVGCRWSTVKYGFLGDTEILWCTRNDQTILGPLYFGLPGNENLTITFQYNLPSKQYT